MYYFVAIKTELKLRKFGLVFFLFFSLPPQLRVLIKIQQIMR